MSGPAAEPPFHDIATSFTHTIAVATTISTTMRRRYRATSRSDRTLKPPRLISRS